MTLAREPLSATILRNGILAIVAGAVIARFWGGWGRWPLATLLACWPSFGGHFVEVWFRNWLRPRIPSARAVQVAVRLTSWFVAGVVFVIAMHLTARAVTGLRLPRWPAWWIGGFAFIGVELVAHLALTLRGRQL